MIEDEIKKISARIKDIAAKLRTEEATKHALILPVLAAIGFDAYDPDIVVPEMTCDVGARKAGKIDYAILSNGIPSVLVECKSLGADLQQHVSQLYRYFSVSSARIGVLTNGTEYWLYTDAIKENVMDLEPYAVVDISAPDADLSPLIELYDAITDMPRLIKRAWGRAVNKRLAAVIEQEMNCPSEKVFKIFAERVFGRHVRMAEVREIMRLASGKRNIIAPIQSSKNVAISEVLGYIEEDCPGISICVRETKRYTGFYPSGRPKTAICRLYFDVRGNARRISIDYESDRRLIEENGLREYRKEIINRARKLQD